MMRWVVSIGAGWGMRTWVKGPRFLFMGSHVGGWMYTLTYGGALWEEECSDDLDEFNYSVIR